MKKISTICAALLLLTAVAAYAPWMTNINHHAQVRIPNGWNTTYEIIVGPQNKQAHIVLSNDLEDEKLSAVAAIVSIEIDKDIDIDAFTEFFEKKILTNPTIVSKEKRGFNNLQGNLVIYDATMDGVELRLMCFFTKHNPYFYAIFTGAEKVKFEEKRAKLEEILVTFQYLKNPK